MKTVFVPAISLGSLMPQNPDISSVGNWIASRKGKESDIVSWAVEETLKAQAGCVDFLCAGGEFYAKRIEESFSLSELSFDMRATASDIEAALSISKHLRWSLPSPSHFVKNEGRGDDADELFDDAANVFLRLFRDMRDAGVSGHVFTAENPCDAELEIFSSGKYLWSISKSGYEAVLERCRDFVIDSADVGLLESLLDSYNIRNIYVKDADVESLKKVFEYFDYDNVFKCGIAPGEGACEYWNELCSTVVRA